MCQSSTPGGWGSLRQGLGSPHATSQHSAYNLRIRREMHQCSFPNLRVISKVLYLGCPRYKTRIRMAPWINKWGAGWSEDFPEFSKPMATVEGRRHCDIRCFFPSITHCVISAKLLCVDSKSWGVLTILLLMMKSEEFLHFRPSMEDWFKRVQRRLR